MFVVGDKVSLKNCARVDGEVKEITGAHARVQWTDDQMWEPLAELIAFDDEKEREEDGEDDVETAECEQCGETFNEVELINVEAVRAGTDDKINEVFATARLCRECAENISLTD